MDLLIGDVFRNAARAVSDRLAVRLGPAALTFAEVDAAANRVGRLLLDRGIRPGHLVVVHSATTLDVVPVFAALAKLGAVFVPVNPALAETERTVIVEAA